MSAIKKSVSFPEELYNWGVERQKDLNLSTFSDYIQHLIRRDQEQTPEHQMSDDQISTLREQVSKITNTLDRMSDQPTKYPKHKREIKIRGTNKPGAS